MDALHPASWYSQIQWSDTEVELPPSKTQVYLIGKAYILFRISDAGICEKCCFGFVVSPLQENTKGWSEGWESVYHIHPKTFKIYLKAN